MIVFRYDKTFEGLLSVVFDAYSRKMFPDKLLNETEIEPMFTTELHMVVTDSENSNRVWSGVQKKLSKSAINMISAVWLSEDIDSDFLIFRFICKVFDNNISIETNFGDEVVLKMAQLAKKVNREAEHLRQFTRLQKAADDMYFAAVAPAYNALPLSIAYFEDRFADQKWVIYDMTRKYGFYYDLIKSVEITLNGEDTHLLTGKLDENLMAEDEKLFQELWRGYFKALTIKERINLKLQRQHMPKRFWKYLTEKQ